MRRWLFVGALALALGLLAVLTKACSSGKKARPAARSGVEAAALATYVAPGDMDEYYLFYSGGHSGQIYVAGVPSMRHICTIPVFTPYPATGYGFDDESKAMLGGFTWGDAHHPALSETDGEYDGRWLFINDTPNNRVARIDLRDFKTKQILGPIPNLSGNHGSSFVTPNTNYLTVATRFSIPIPKGTYAPTSDYATKYKGVAAGIAIAQDGTMSVAWQVLLPPFNYDLGDAGKGPSEGWLLWTCYNSERATGKLEETASQRDQDYIVAVDYRKAEQAIAANNYTMIGGVKVIDPAKARGVAYLIPCAKSPHGVDVSPDGRYFVGSGKLSPTTTVFSFEKMQQAIASENFVGDEDGIPILKYDAVREAEVQIGLGPLHTQFDDKGFAYTSLFLDSKVAKWRMSPPWDVVDAVPVAYNIGHLCAAEGDSRSPDGKYLVALNKLSKGRHLNVGPSIPESSQLIDINSDPMTLLYDAFTEPEPHYAQMIKADKIHPINVYPKEEQDNPHAIWEESQARVERQGNNVVVYMIAVRTHYAPMEIEVRQGDRVTIHITNIEQTEDELHGFAIAEYNINLVVDPGEVKSVTFVANKPGVFPFYCTNFCSALHQEMQGYFLVRPTS